MHMCMCVNEHLNRNGIEIKRVMGGKSEKKSRRMRSEKELEKI